MENVKNIQRERMKVEEMERNRDGKREIKVDIGMEREIDNRIWRDKENFIQNLF